jgi:hypothetical protein
MNRMRCQAIEYFGDFPSVDHVAFKISCGNPGPMPSPIRAAGFVERLPVLQKSLGSFPLFGELPPFHLLQHISTVFGVLGPGILAGRPRPVIAFSGEPRC